MTRKLVLALLGLCALAGQAHAGLLDEAQENPFLPVDEAFALEAAGMDNDQLVVRWVIAEDYYLYRHRLGFRVTEPGNLTPGEAIIPTGKHKHDEYFGDVEVYYKQLEVRLPLPAGTTVPDFISLDVDFQGCAEKGLCYPPQTRSLVFDTGRAASAPAPGTAATPAPPSETDRLAGLIGSGSWFSFILQFFGLGLLLAFTPCILPMIPILSGVIVGLDQEGNTFKGFLLSLSYVLAMAGAYAFLGAIAGVFGHNLQAVMQAPVFIGFFSAVFVMLALAMFGVYRLQLPSGWQTRVQQWSSRHQGGTFAGAAIMGFLAALIVGPCLAPPLAGALLYIGQTGDPVRGASALFSLGMGMGMPLIILGTLEGRLLPRSGAWMERVNHVFGVILLGVAIWLLGRVIPDQWSMLLWAALVIGSGLHMGALERSSDSSWARTGQAIGLVAVLYGAMILVGGMLGGDDPLRPIPRGQLVQGTGEPGTKVSFRRIKTHDDLQLALQEASSAGRPVMLDFYADWCVSCHTMEDQVFPAVRMQLDNLLLLQADVTANDAEDRALMKALEVMGPPTILFFSPAGNEQRGLRLVGELDVADFSSHLERVLTSR